MNKKYYVSNILDLPIKSKWYEMIENGIKKEEYREIKEYWEKRLQYDTLFFALMTMCVLDTDTLNVL